MNSSNKALQKILVFISFVLIIAAWLTASYLSRLNKSSWQTKVESGQTEVHFIDVGQGDCQLIRSGSMNVLIDAGESDKAAEVISYLDSFGIQRLDYVIATHPHSDHIGALDEVIEKYEIGKVIMPRLKEEIVPTTACYKSLLEAISKKGLKITEAVAGNTYQLDGSTLEIIAPVKKYDDINNSSVVCRLVCGRTDFLFTGDIEKEAEQDILDSGAFISAGVLKAAHHGSSGSSSAEFLEAVNMDYAVISCGADNSYGHPHDKAVSRINAICKNIIRTDLSGNIVFYWDGNSLSYMTEK